MKYSNFSISGNRQSLEAVVVQSSVFGLFEEANQSPGHLQNFLAEEEGFEPPRRFRQTVFKTAALNHSATPPGKVADGGGFEPPVDF